MGKRVVFFLLVVVFVSGCARTSTTAEVLPTATKGAPLYKVTKSTGLYDAPDFDAKILAELSVGTLLKPANNEPYYDCKIIEEPGLTATLCFVEVINTGETGWVLQKWTERQ